MRIVSLVFLLSGCSKGSIDTDGIVDTDDDTSTPFDETACFSGVFWNRGDEGSSLMHPGGDCLDCHRSEEGPTFKAAGTVFTGLHEPDDCYGQSGVTVEITDNDGVVHAAKTNSAGNFSFARTQSIPTPYTARVFNADGLESAMSGHQTSGSCNSCHTVNGTDDAPGRIRLR